MSELTRRILFGVVAAPLSLLVVYIGDGPLASLLAGIAAIAAWELYRMARVNGVEPFDYAGMLFAAMVPMAVHAQYLGVVHVSLTFAVVAFLAIFASALWLRWPDGRPRAAVGVTMLGVVYPASVAYVYSLRYHQYTVDAAGGTALVGLPILLTWATDTGAYAFGRMFGKHKLMPSVSPGKTREGAVGGILLAIAVAFAYVKFVLVPYAHLSMRPGYIVLFAIAISVAAQLGDLTASLLKREAGVKDSSKIFPGHGGVIDRFDSLLFVLPVAFLLLNMFLLPVPR